MDDTSSRSHVAWADLVSELQAKFEDRGYVVTNINTDKLFCRELKALCVKYHSKTTTPLITGAQLSFRRVSKFIRAVKELVQGLADVDLHGLVWGASFRAIECMCDAGADLAAATELVEDSNRRMPPIDEHLIDFAYYKKMQKSLQDMFRTLVESYLYFIDQASKTPSASPFNPSEEKAYLVRAGATLDKYHEEFDNDMNFAKGLFQWYDTMNARDSGAWEVNNASIRQAARRNIPEASADEFIELDWLGSGTFGGVSKVIWTKNNAVYARKHIRTTEAHDAVLVRNEVENMTKLKHKHIVTVSFHVPEVNGYSILMLPVAEENLLEFMNRCVNSSFADGEHERIWGWFGCLLSALEYAHKKEIQHHDIKPRNILIHNGEPLLTDFGLSRDISNFDNSDDSRNPVKGTPMYRAPEVFQRGDRERGRATDVFSLGCVFSEMLTVANRESLEAFRVYRRNQDVGGSVENQYSFRYCLKKVSDWLKRYRMTEQGNSVRKETIFMMDEDPDVRPKALRSIKALKDHKELFCGAIHNASVT